MEKQRVIPNTEIREIELAVPDGHRHLRAAIRLQNGEVLVLQEATVANLVRAYVTVKTDPVKTSVTLTGRLVSSGDRKDGFADWQLLEGGSVAGQGEEGSRRDD